MINTYLTGRLGNQMFQYACARSIQIRHEKLTGQKIDIACNLYELNHIDVKSFKEKTKFRFDLEDYRLVENICKIDSKPMWYQDFSNPIIRIAKKISPILLFRVLSKKGTLLWQGTDYIPFPNEIYMLKSVFVSGWYQDIKYFNEIQDVLKKDFEPKYPPLIQNIKTLEMLQNNNVTCISVRGGNYLSPKVKRKLFVCDKNYFYNAIQAMHEKEHSTIFYVCSDDHHFVKKYLKLEDQFPGYKFIFEDKENPVWEKLRLMTYCRNYIISNSTFSWWAQFLSNSQKKTVIAPSTWYTNGKKNGLYEKDWILIDIKSDLFE